MDQDQQIAELVARAQSGDEGSVSRLFELLSNRIFRFFSIRTSDRETAEDLTQTVFLEMIQALPRYKVQHGAKFTTWLFQLARFRLIDHYRKRRSQVPLDDAPEVMTEPLAETDPITAGRVETALRQLPEKYQTVLHLKFREDLSAAEIARVIHTTALNVRVIQFRALKALRRYIEHHHPHDRP